jgi:light-regulated signal transduction histidine kinase (bacteriophytochrome)
MANWQVDDVLDAAVQSIINARCHPAYVHDMRGGLQAIFSAVELLSRAAKLGTADAGRLDNAVGLAKRAMANQQQSVLRIINQITVPPEDASALDLTQLLSEVQQFLRNDAANKDIRLQIQATPGITVSAPRTKLRSLLVGLMALSIDALPAGEPLRIDLTQVREAAVLELRSTLTYGAIRTGLDLLRAGDEEFQPRDLLLSALRRALLTHGGGLEVESAAGGSVAAGAASVSSVLRVWLPLAQA